MARCVVDEVSQMMNYSTCAALMRRLAVLMEMTPLNFSSVRLLLAPMLVQSGGVVRPQYSGAMKPDWRTDSGVDFCSS
jgi:hypothetical protein